MTPISKDSDFASTILLADDEKQWLYLTRLELVNTGIKNLIEEAKDGDGVIEMLSRRLKKSSDALPLFVLLDVEMPRSNGFHALRWIRSQPALEELPVMMLTSSELQRDIDEAFEGGADAYLVKGKNAEAFTFIYEKARMVRRGKLKRRDAFRNVPASRQPSAPEVTEVLETEPESVGQS